MTTVRLLTDHGIASQMRPHGDRGEKWSYELPVEKRAPQAVQKDDACARATEVAHGELDFAGIHNEVYRVVRQGGGDGTTSRRVGQPTRAEASASSCSKIPETRRDRWAAVSGFPSCHQVDYLDFAPVSVYGFGLRSSLGELA